MNIQKATLVVATLTTLTACTKNLHETTTDPLSAGTQKTSLTNFLVSPPGDVVGKVTVGYQGWFSAAGDASPNNYWNHDNLEMWPDTREYTNLYSGTPFPQEGVAEPGYTGNLGNGQPALMFSSYDQSTVNLHFKWMQQYGIDCAALQRFANEITPGDPHKTQRDSVSVRVRNAALAYNRKFYIEYDCSGQTDMSVLKRDWTNTITGPLALTSSPAYARQNGRPVVSIYGLGYAGHGTSVADAIDVINWFKSQGCYVIGAVAGQWRTGSGDSQSGFMSAYKTFNMISAWAVGRAVDGSYAPWVAADRDTCTANGIDYQPCAYPGTAYHNSNGSNSPKNGFPRNHGDFLWSQFATFRNAGVNSVFIAMFDEMNEATSIFKVAEDVSMIPDGKYFLTLDADGAHVSSDFYLRLTNDGGKMLKGQIPYNAIEPTPFLPDSSGSGPLPNGTYKIINRNSGLAVDVTGQSTANGASIQQWGYAGGANQQWTLTSLGNGRYKIIGVQSGRALDITGGATTPGAKLILNDYSNSSSEQWVISTVTGSFFTIRNAQSGYAMEIPAFSTVAGTTIDQWTSDGGTNQQWSIQTP